jgi:hypothetical protein
MSRNRRNRRQGIPRALNALSAPIASNVSQNITQVVSTFANIGSSAGGFITSIVDLNPTGYAGWAGFAALFDEWRLIGGEIVLTPINVGVGNANSLLVTVFDNDDASTALTSQAQAMTYATKMMTPAFWTNGAVRRMRFHKYNPTSTGVGQNVWATTAAPTANPCAIKMYAGGLTATQNYVAIIVRSVVEFRGRIA